ncbi:hypothetical protein HDE_01108 [Halotydeus destructor]|nr:hypothetical protein HDE_01108 [Halotydeus destructor]
MKSPLVSMIFPQRHVSFLGLMIGFTLVWTIVLSGLLVENSVDQADSLHQAVSLFNIQQDLGRIIFAVGHEMVSTVDLLLTENPDNRSADFDHRLSITWKMTDTVIDSVESHASVDWVPGSDELLEDIRSKLREFRVKNLRQILTPHEAINLFLTMCETVQHRYHNSAKYQMVQAYAENNQWYPLIGTSYPLFNHGMAFRFAELALGTLYFRSGEPINAAQFFEIHHASEALILSSFKYNHRIRMRYFEAQIMEPQLSEVLDLVRDDILSGGVNRTSNVHAALYLDGVKDQIAGLLLAKDYLNSTISSEIIQLSRSHYTKLHCHLFVASVAVAASLTTCMLLLYSFRYLSSPTSGSPVKPAEKNNKPETAEKQDGITSIYKPGPVNVQAELALKEKLNANFPDNEMIHFLPANYYTKPRCYI